MNNIEKIKIKIKIKIRNKIIDIILVLDKNIIK